VKKPKVLGHMGRCGSRSVSCVDCGVQFDVERVKMHTSCVSEAEKYGHDRVPGRVGAGEAGAGAECAVCSVKLHGAVAAEQHYTSKKHRAAVRRAKNSSSNGTAKSAGDLPGVKRNDRPPTSDQPSSGPSTSLVSLPLKKLIHKTMHAHAKSKRRMKLKKLQKILQKETSEKWASCSSWEEFHTQVAQIADASDQLRLDGKYLHYESEGN